MMNREQIKAVYDQGPEAVIELVERLFAIIAEQQQQIAALTERVKELEARLNTDSHNSNQPPSTDGFKKKSRSLRSRHGRKSGAQAGHTPHRLQPVAHPDHLILHPLSQCPGCQAGLTEVAAHDHQARQVFDLPEIRLQVREHRAEVKSCPACGLTAMAAFPPALTQPAQYGERVKALAVYLMTYQLLPYRRTRDLLADLLGQALAEGTLSAALSQAAAQLEPTEATIRQGVRQAALAHFDETGLYVAGQRHWLHVAATPQLTAYAYHAKRGGAAFADFGILPQFSGTALHDAWPAYFGYGCRHALCNAHHLRELTYLEEEWQSRWAGKMKKLLLAIKQRVEEAVAAGKRELAVSERRSFVRRYQRVVREGLASESQKPALATGKRGKKKQSQAKNLLDRLRRYRKETLGFMEDFAVPFDNNLAERDLRMMKVKQKVSGCFRSAAGAEKFCRIRSYVSTMRKQGHNVLTVLKSVFTGHPIAPALSG
jgi:transposase